MAENQKNLYYANFNITFGENNDPMLTHFKDIIYPAFCEGIKRGNEEADAHPIFYLNDVKVKEIGKEYVLVGNHIKDDEVIVRTTVKNEKLVETPAQVSTAPYSRFIIFLKNHRMILVKNEKDSPNIKSFQTTVRKILNTYINKINKELGINLPVAHVNIVDIPLSYDIKNAVKNVQKIESMNLRFFPLNNDFNASPLAQNIDEEMKKMGSKTANMKFNSPTSSKAVIKLLEESSGLAEVTLRVRDANGNKMRIRNDQFSSNKAIKYSGNITDMDDEYLINQLENDNVINKTSEDNQKIYERYIQIIKDLL